MNPKTARHRLVATVLIGSIAITATLTGAVLLAADTSRQPLQPAAAPSLGPTTSVVATPATTVPAGSIAAPLSPLPDDRTLTKPLEFDGRTDFQARARFAGEKSQEGRTMLRAGYERMGNSTCTGYDGDGDATPEWIGCDNDGDGFAEIQAWDSDENGRFEWVRSPAGGVVGGLMLGHDADQDGRVEHLILDGDGNGRSEAQYFDENRDGVMDWYQLDRFWSDGLADTWVRAGSPGAQRTTDQQAIEHIATMDALRSLCRAQRLC